MTIIGITISFDIFFYILVVWPGQGFYLVFPFLLISLCDLLLLSITRSDILAKIV